MKIRELNLHCGECDIIDYCPEYPNTPICAQPRFWDVDVDLYWKIAEETEASDDEERAHKVYQKLLEEENQRLREALEALQDQLNILSGEINPTIEVQMRIILDKALKGDSDD